jgi:hypothetical protein
MIDAMLSMIGRTPQIGAVIAAGGLALAPLGIPAAGRADSAHTASRSIYVNEHAQLRLISHHSGLLYEQGTFSGTPGGAVSVQIRISYTQSSISFSTTPSGGTVSGSGHASVYAEGAIAHFSGSVAVTHGTGRYSGASASALHISGLFQRKTYATSLTVRGEMST